MVLGTLEYSFTKARLTKGWSYPLKRTKLDAAVLEAGVSNLGSVVYLLDRRPLSNPHRPPLSVVFHGEDAPYAIAGGCVITVRTVPSDARFAIADGLEALLGDVARWMADIPARPPTWRSESHSLEAIFTDGLLRLSEDFSRRPRQ